MASSSNDEDIFADFHVGDDQDRDDGAGEYCCCCCCCFTEGGNDVDEAIVPDVAGAVAGAGAGAVVVLCGAALVVAVDMCIMIDDSDHKRIQHQISSLSLACYLLLASSTLPHLDLCLSFFWFPVVYVFAATSVPTFGFDPFVFLTESNATSLLLLQQ
jgi:hypothetical protein